MRIWISLNRGPCEEELTPVGGDDTQMYSECRRYIALLRKKFGQEPTTSRMTAKHFQAEQGSYWEVVLWYHEGDEAALAYAGRCRSEAPTRWDMPDPCESCGTLHTEPTYAIVEGLDANVYHAFCKPPLQMIIGVCEACDWELEAKRIPTICPRCGAATSPHIQ